MIFRTGETPVIRCVGFSGQARRLSYVGEGVKRAEIEACGIVIVKENKNFILIIQEALEDWGETAELLQAQSPTHRQHPRERR